MIEVLSTGLPNLVQDLGRSGHLSLGVSRSGALDPYALSLGNLSVGNAAGSAGIEISLFPFRVRFLTDSVFCCSGADCEMQREGDDKPLPSWWVHEIRAGQTLTIGMPRRGARAYLTVRGGIRVPEVMGSSSTDLKTAFGGHQGRGLRRGDALSVGEEARSHVAGRGIAAAELGHFWRELERRSISVRVLPAAEFSQFTAEAQQHFLNTPYVITPQANRMGYRLAGEQLALRQALELFSHGIVAGTVQVPPAGQPIIQLSEANTCGGYPKIATVIQADLWKLGQAPIGSALRFELSDSEQATQALRRQLQERQQLEHSIAMLGSQH